MPINLVNKLNMQSETHLNIITERIKLKDRKNENIIEYNNKSIENFLFDFEKVNDDLPLEFLEVLKKSRFSYEELILSLSFVYCLVKVTNVGQLGLHITAVMPNIF